MVKLLVCVCFGLVLSAIMLQLRQQDLSLNYQTSALHSQIESRQTLLWSQQLRIAEATAPNAIAAKVRQDRIPLAPEARPQAQNWLAPQPVVTASASTDD
jgi:cell division protein FtsL